MFCRFALNFNFFTAFSTARRCLQPTSERLGAAAAYTTVHAGYKRSFSHCLFRGVTAAITPNRPL